MSYANIGSKQREGMGPANLPLWSPLHINETSIKNRFCVYENTNLKLRSRPIANILKTWKDILLTPSRDRTITVSINVDVSVSFGCADNAYRTPPPIRQNCSVDVMILGMVMIPWTRLWLLQSFSNVSQVQKKKKIKSFCGVRWSVTGII